ncbi:MAG: tetratricopeptide repeat protein, partial [Candidatus Marinimicrobia bacterium]|nr:tetratricopeptide repeat protein [Candidatus Neomarinimicrobiota bacterium]
ANPERKASYANLALLYVRNENYQQALDILDSARIRFPNDPSFLLAQGSIYNTLRDYQSAEKVLLKTLQIEPNNVQAQHLLAAIWDMLKKYSQCDSLYEVIIRHNPDDVIALNNYAYSLAVRGERLDEALKMVDLALVKEPNNASYLDTKGWILYRQKKYKEAIKYIQKSLEIEQDNAEVLEHLGDVYQALRQPKKARTYYQRAAEIDKNNENLKRKLQP